MKWMGASCRHKKKEEVGKIANDLQTEFRAPELQRGCC